MDSLSDIRECSSDAVAEPRHSQIALVGHGVAALTLLSVFQAEGVSRDAMIVYGDQSDPFANFRRYTTAIRQDRMRSESSGHFFPADYPGPALLDSLRYRTPLPLLQSLFDRYQPQRDDLLAHGDAVARTLKPMYAFVHARVERIAYAGADRFELFDRGGRPLGTAQQVVLALGHPGLRYPDAL